MSQSKTKACLQGLAGSTTSELKHPPRMALAVVGVPERRGSERGEVERSGTEPSERARSGETPTTASAPTSPLPGEGAAAPDPEVPERPARRRFTAEYKLRILREADACTEPGAIGSLLRREGLYSSHLSAWRQQREQGALSALAARKRGRPSERQHPLAKRLAVVEREKRQLERRLKKAEALLELQKKSRRSWGSTCSRTRTTRTTDAGR